MSCLVGDSRRHILSWRGSYRCSTEISMGQRHNLSDILSQTHIELKHEGEIIKIHRCLFCYCCFVVVVVFWVFFFCFVFFLFCFVLFVVVVVVFLFFFVCVFFFFSEKVKTKNVLQYVLYRTPAKY